MACLFSLYFVVGLASCSQGGFYFFHLLDRYAAGYSMLFAVLFESIAVSWIYGTKIFFSNLQLNVLLLLYKVIIFRYTTIL